MKDKIKILIAALAGAVLVGGGTGAYFISRSAAEEPPEETTAATTVEGTTMDETTVETTLPETTPAETTPEPVTAPKEASTTSALERIPLSIEKILDGVKIEITQAYINYEHKFISIDYSSEAWLENRRLVEKKGTVNEVQGYGANQMWFYLSDPENASGCILTFELEGHEGEYQIEIILPAR